MVRTLKLLMLPPVMTAMLAGIPAVASAEGGGESKATVLEKLQQMDKRLEESFKRIGDDMAALKADALMAKGQLQTARDKIEQFEKDMADAKKDLIQMRMELDEFKKGGSGTVTTKPLYPPEQTSLESIARRLGKIEQDLARLNPPRVSQYPPAPPTGRLKLVNDSAEELQFVVNGRIYRVVPGMTHLIEQVPAGPFNYEVVSPTWGLRASRSPTLVAGDTFTLVAHY
jgi:hypothetical protein